MLLTIASPKKCFSSLAKNVDGIYRQNGYLIVLDEDVIIIAAAVVVVVVVVVVIILS